MVKTIDPAPGRYDADDGFGSTKGRKYPHTGIDFAVPSGTNFPAFASGTVVFAGWEPTGGNGYCLAWRLDGVDKYAAYLHGLRIPPVDVGEHITVGQRGVFFSGNSGTNSQGPHVHLTLSGSPRAYQGYAPLFDPWAFIQAGLTDVADFSSKPLINLEDEMNVPVLLTVNDPKESNYGSIAERRGTEVRMIPVGDAGAAMVRAIHAEQVALVGKEINVGVTGQEFIAYMALAGTPAYGH